MLLRNMSSQAGLCNGTRLIVKKMYRHVLDCEIATGAESHIGNRVLIPRITLSPSDDILPFTLKRKQFPVRPAFGMTINKAQGQTLKFAAGYLPRPVFSHGQLYVLMSRVGSPDCLTIMVPGGRLVDGTAITDNVVFTFEFIKSYHRKPQQGSFNSITFHCQVNVRIYVCCVHQVIKKLIIRSYCHVLRSIGPSASSSHV